MNINENINEMIAKYDIRLGFQNGVEGLRVYKTNLTQSEIAMIKAAKPDIMAELHRRKKEEKKAEEEKAAKKLAEKQAIMNGEIEIKLSYQDGEYLSGYIVYGAAAELLAEIGVAEYVDCWGYYVEQEVVKALGEKFTYQQAIEYIKPINEAKEQAKAEKEKEDIETEQEAFKQAKETNKPVVIRTYTAKCNDPHEECNTDIITIYAMPDGSTKTTRNHTW